MRNTPIFLFFFLSSMLLKAQFSGPYRIAFNTTIQTYLVTNQVSGTVAELNASFKPTNVITGLKKPTDLEIASFGANTGLLLLDDKKLHLYSSSTYDKIIDFTINGASDLIDLAIDPKNAGDFYITDRGNNAIIKGVVGPPPFYTPTFTTLVDTGLNRPSALLFNNEGELLVAEDANKSEIFKVDKNSGALTPLYSTGMDSVNAMVQDAQGNIYITNWGNSKQYRIDSGFRSQKELLSLNKPAGMFIDASKNLLLTACFKCNKLEFQSLHLLIPQSDLFMCKNEGNEIKWDIRFTGVSTWAADNQFIVELSDSFGSFNNPTKVQTVSGKLRPSSIVFSLTNNGIGSQHKYRVRTTNPSYLGSEKSIYFWNTPRVDIATQDTLYTCLNSQIKLGSPSEPNTDYVWTNHADLSSQTLAQPIYKPSISDTVLLKVSAENTRSGCRDDDSITIIAKTNAQLPGLIREKEICSGDSVAIGMQVDHYTYSWSSQLGLNDSSAATPIFKDTTSRKYHVQIKDTINSCFGYDSVEVEVNPLPNVSFPDYVFCEGDPLLLSHNNDTSYQYAWNPSFVKDWLIREPTISIQLGSRASAVGLTVTNKHNCKTYSPVYVRLVSPGLEVLNSSFSTQLTYDINIDEDKMEWEEIQKIYIQADSNGKNNWITTDSLQIGQKKDTIIPNPDWLADYRIIYITKNGCTYFTEIYRQIRLNIPDKKLSTISITQNPISSIIQLKGIAQKMDYQLVDVNGKIVAKGIVNASHPDVNMFGISSGIFYLQLFSSQKNERQTIVVVKH